MITLRSWTEDTRNSGSRASNVNTVTDSRTRLIDERVASFGAIYVIHNASIVERFHLQSELIGEWKHRLLTT